MVADGADTIYDPEQWVVASYIDPRRFISVRFPTLAECSSRPAGK